MAGDRWPPVYDAEDLVREIKRLTDRPVAVDKHVFIGAPTTATVEARMAHAAWVLLNACLVRFLARDDGRYA